MRRIVFDENFCGTAIDGWLEAADQALPEHSDRLRHLARQLREIPVLDGSIYVGRTVNLKAAHKHTEMRRCTHCGQDKALHLAFGIDRHDPEGRKQICKACHHMRRAVELNESTRLCSHCGQHKQISDFYGNGHQQRYTCKPCFIAQMRGIKMRGCGDDATPLREGN